MADPAVHLDGLVFPESPRWYDGRLWLADWGAGEALVVDADGRRTTVAALPSFPSCLDFLSDGRLLLVDSAAGRLLRREPDGALVTHADLSALSPHPWNEVVVDARDRAYVGGIGYDFPAGEPGPGLLALVDGGRARVVADDLAFPNGMALTADGGTLLVAESHAGRITAFDTAADGALHGRRTWADLGDAAPDGICLDVEGACWYADVPHRRAVRVAEGGAVLDVVDLDRGAFSCALGGTTLYVVANRWGGGDDGEGDDDGPAGRVVAVTVAVPGPERGPARGPAPSPSA